MNALIILALVTAVTSGPVEILSDGTYHKTLDQVDDVKFYDQFWDNSSGIDNFITNGHDANLGQFPFVARVSIVRSTSSGTCSGSFITENFALTASHCLNSNPHLITSIGLLVGTVDRSQPGGVTMQMAEFWWHPQESTLSEDVGLIRSTNNLPSGNPNIVPIRIPSRAQTNNAFPGPVTLIGWGRDNTGSSAIRLQWAPFSAVPFSMCLPDRFREPSEICYIDPDRVRASQPGDSGGPLIVWEAGVMTQVGINAGVRTSGGNSFFSAARISAFLPWLEERGIRIRDV